LSAQAGALNRGMKQEPKRHALAERGGVLLPCIPIGLVKCTPVDHGPIVTCPFGRSPPICTTTWALVLRAAGAAARVAAYAAMPPAAIVARNLASERLDVVVHGGSSQVKTWPGMGGRRGR
jgi:hypothetical protein